MKSGSPIVCFHMFPFFSDKIVAYSQLNFECVAQSTFLVFCIFDKLSRKKLDIVGYDDQTMCLEPPIFMLFHLHLNFTISICEAWDDAKIHTNCMLFEFYCIAFTNASTFFSINV